MMQKILAALLVMGTLASAPAQAQYYPYRGGYHGHPSNAWVGPALGGLALGAIIGGAMQQQAPPPPAYYYAPPPAVYYAPPPVVVQCQTVVAGYDATGRAILQEICR